MMRVFWRSIAACVLVASLMAQLPALAQKTTPYTDPASGLKGTETTSTVSLANGNTETTVAHDVSGLDVNGNYVHYVSSSAVEKDRDGNKVKEIVKITNVKYDKDPKQGGKQISSGTFKETDTYNAIGGYDQVIDVVDIDNKTGETKDEHSDVHRDASGSVTGGHRTSTTRKPGEKPVKEEHEWNPGKGWQKVSLSSTHLDQINAQPGNGSSNETAVLPDVAGPGSTIVATFSDPDQQSGPPGQALVGFEDQQGRRSFFKTVANAQHHVAFKIAESIAAVWLFKTFKHDGTPDDGAVKCAVARNATVADTDAVPRVPANGPAITRASSAYERGGSTNGLVNLQTRGNDPLTSRVLMDGSSNGIDTVAASDMDVKGRLHDDATLGRHAFSVQSASKVSNVVPGDIVTLRADPVPPGETGSVSTLTVHVDGLPASDTATMYFLVSGSAQLADGGETTSVPVRDGIAQVRIRGVRSGPALVKYKLQAHIAGFWS